MSKANEAATRDINNLWSELIENQDKKQAFMNHPKEFLKSEKISIYLKTVNGRRFELGEFIGESPANARMAILESIISMITNTVPTLEGEEPERTPYWGVNFNAIANLNVWFNANAVANANAMSNANVGANANAGMNANANTAKNVNVSGEGNPQIQSEYKGDINLTYSDKYLKSELHRYFQTHNLTTHREKVLLIYLIENSGNRKNIEYSFHGQRIKIDIEMEDNIALIKNGELINERKEVQ